MRHTGHGGLHSFSTAYGDAMGQAQPYEETLGSWRRERRRLAALMGLASAGLLGSRQARAKDYPTRPVKLLVGFPAGGGLDHVAREIGPVLAERLGQPVIIENKPGVSGVLAATAAARSDPDGYTLVMTVPASMSAARLLLGPRLQYDPVADLQPIGMIGVTPLALLVAANNPRLRSLADLEAAAKASGSNGFDVASQGLGSPPHFAIELYKARSGLPLRHIAFAGSAAALTALLGGHVPAMVTTVTAAMGPVAAGQATALAITGRQALAQMPGVPLLEPKGEPIEITSWTALHVRSSTPAPVVELINRELNQVLESEPIKRRLANEIILTPSTPEDVNRYVAAETRRLTDVASLFNLKFQ